MIAARIVTALAGLLVLLALVTPNRLGQLSLVGLVRIPVEALLVVALLLVLPDRPRRIVAIAFGVALGLLTVLKVTNMGFLVAFARPFDPIVDWSFFGPFLEFLSRSFGRALAIVATVVGAVLIIAVLIAMPLAVLRLSRVAVRHRVTTARTTVVLGVVWVVCAVFGLQIVGGLPVAADSAAGLAYEQVRQVRADLLDHDTFASEVASDAYRDKAGADLLTALRGKDVLLVFVESYGRVALEDPLVSPEVAASLEAGSRRLEAAGYGSRSAFLTSSTAGGASWLAHSTLQSGLYVGSQQRYNQLMSTGRLTLSTAFRRAGWRTVGMLPGNDQDWPDAHFYDYGQIYDSRNIGYRGPQYSFASIPDQYTLSAFQRTERATPNRAPLFAEIDLLSSHAPWEPVPQLIDWQAVGDGSVFSTAAGAHDAPESVFSQPIGQVRTDYGHSIAYALDSLLSYVEHYGDDNLVVMFLGDHQPAPIVAGEGATRDVPISIVARDPAVLERIGGWGWQDGLHPDPHAPVWPMQTFRDRFLAAFGPAGHLPRQRSRRLRPAILGRD
jgi:hypothetical protein